MYQVQIEIIIIVPTLDCMSTVLMYSNQSCNFLASKEFIEARRRALRRFVNLVGRHPVLYDDKLVVFFLTVKASVGKILKLNFQLLTKVEFKYYSCLSYKKVTIFLILILANQLMLQYSMNSMFTRYQPFLLHFLVKVMSSPWRFCLTRSSFLVYGFCQCATSAMSWSGALLK